MRETNNDSISFE